MAFADNSVCMKKNRQLGLLGIEVEDWRVKVRS